MFGRTACISCNGRRTLTRRSSSIQQFVVAVISNFHLNWKFANEMWASERVRLASISHSCVCVCVCTFDETSTLTLMSDWLRENHINDSNRIDGRKCRGKILTFLFSFDSCERCSHEISRIILRNSHDEWRTHTHTHVCVRTLIFLGWHSVRQSTTAIRIEWKSHFHMPLVVFGGIGASRVGNIDRGVGCIINQWQSANVNAIRFDRVAQILKNTPIRACLLELLNVSSRRTSGDDGLTHGKVEGGQQSRG